MVEDVKPGGVFLINCQWDEKELSEKLNAETKSCLLYTSNPAPATKNTVSAPAPAIVPAANVAPAPAAEKKRVPDGEKNYNLFEDVTDGAALCYEYEESLCLFDGAFDHIPVSYTHL